MWIKLDQISPRARGSVCSACGSGRHSKTTGGALSTGVFVEHEGEIELCARCLREAGVILGMIDAERLEELAGEYAQLQEWAAEAYAELQHRDETIRALSSALARANGALAEIEVPA